MKHGYLIASLLGFLLPLDAQVVAELKRSPGSLPEVRIRNHSAFSLAAFAIRMDPLVRDDENRLPLLVFVDTLTDTAETPLLPNHERTVPVTVRFRPGQRIEELFAPPILSAGISSDGATTGDDVLLARLMSRRGNMLLAVETTLETLSDAGRRNVPRAQLIEQFRKLADSVSRWYLPPEQQVGRRLYQSMIGKLMNLPEGQAGSPFPPSTFVGVEVAALNRQRVALAESQPSLANAFPPFRVR